MSSAPTASARPAVPDRLPAGSGRPARSRARRAIAPLLETPSTIPALAAIAVFLVWAGKQAGYVTTTWYPGAILLVGLLVVAALAAPRGWTRAVPRLVWIAWAALLAYTAWSFITIAWAGDRGDAWDGANRTLLYAVVFALFALWRHRRLSAGLVLGAWTLGVSAIGIYFLWRLRSGGGVSAAFDADRLAAPSGYPNADAALWLMAFWPALALAARREVPWALRGLFAGTALVLLDLCLLCQSRGALYSAPIVLALFFIFVPGRPRAFLTAVAIAVGAALTMPAILHAQARIRDGVSPAHAIPPAIGPVLLVALALAVALAAVGLLERLRPLSPALALRVRRVVGACGLACAAGIVVVGLIAAGNPAHRVSSAWASFKRGYSYAPTALHSSRLTFGLGSNRYDFYRVALKRFEAHPLVGIGADNYAQDYLALGRSSETPHYPHSLELRTLTDTGVIGALLLFGAFGAAVWAAGRRLRRGDMMARVLAGSCLMVFGYWAIHGSIDWFWEFPGLGAPAFAMLGLACALPDPRRGAAGAAVADPASHAVSGTTSDVGSAPGATRPAPSRRHAAALAGTFAATLVAGAALISLALPWIAELDVSSALASWRTSPAAAYRSLERAASLNRLSDRAYLVAGTIALRRGELGRAENAFSAALARTPREAYAALELGAIESNLKRPALARALLERADQLSPRDPFTQAALAEIRAHRRIDIGRLNDAILTHARSLH